jgi:hypothetical protein
VSFLKTGIDWEQAKCRGMETNDFYTVEEKRQTLKVQQELMEVIRPTCFSCPIWQDCLRYAMKNEEFGVWGGLTSTERNSFKSYRFSDIKNRTIKMLKPFGISEADVLDLVWREK